jgi:hypothetical protein
MIKDRRIDPEIDEGTSKFFNRIVWILIVINIILGSILIYDKFIYDHTPKVYRDTSIIQTNEI